jgi:MFS family permease
MAKMTEPPGNGASEASVAELVKQLSEQTSRLARQEVELAKAELQTKGRRAGIGAGMFGGAGIFGFYAFGALTAAAILGLATAVAGWLAALIVSAALGVIAGLLALQGKNRVQAASPPVPEQATESVKEDVQWAKTRAQAGRR